MTVHLKQIVALTLAATAGFASRYYSEPAHLPANALAGTVSGRPAETSLRGLQGEAILRAIDQTLEEVIPHKRVRRLRNLLSELEPADFPAVLDHLYAKGEDPEIFDKVLDLLEEWATMDPMAAARWHERLTNESQRLRGVCFLVRGWACNDPVGALAWARGLPDPDLQSSARENFFHALASHDPAKALAILQTDGEITATDRSRVFEAITKKDPRMAIDAALALPEEIIRDQVLVAIAGQWASSDAKAAASWIRELPPGKVRDQAMARLTDVLTWQDPALAAQVAMNDMAPGSARDEKVFSAVREWTTKDQAAALAWVERLPEGFLQGRALFILSEKWVEDAPEDAMRRALQVHRPESNDTSMISTVLAQWIANDPAGGIQWLNHHSAEIPAEAISSAISRLAYYNPAHAAELAARLPEGNQQGAAYRDLGYQWAWHDPEAANRWLEKMPEGISRDRFSQGLITYSSYSDFDLARQRAERLQEGSIKSEVMENLAETWARNDPVAALDWVAQSPVVNERLAPRIIATWVKADINAASDWLNTLPAGSLRDSAIQGFANAAASYDPESAAAWANSVGDVTKRRDALGQVFRQWVWEDEPAAKAWVQAAEIPSEWKPGLLKK